MKTMIRPLTIALLLLGANTGIAQHVAHFVNEQGELIVFDEGRFERLSPAPPRQVKPLGHRLLFEDHKGLLLLYTERGKSLNRIAEPGTFSALAASGDRAAFRQGDALMAVLGDRAVQLCPRAGRFTVSDSLIVYHDLDARQLRVHWKGASHALATIEGQEDLPHWESGPNTVVFFNKAARKLLLFHRGEVQVLADGTDVGRAAAGADLVAFQGVEAGGFSIFDRGRIIPVSFAPAFRFDAGRDLVAFVDHGGRLRAYAGGAFTTLCDSMPTTWEVRDSVVVFIEGNMLKTLHDGRVDVVESYVPELWVINGGAIHYTDLNRTLYRYRAGQRERLFREAGITGLEVFGSTVLFRSFDGRVRIHWKDKLFAY